MRSIGALFIGLRAALYGPNVLSVDLHVVENKLAG